MAKIMLIHMWGEIGGAGVSLLHLERVLSKKHEVVIYCPDQPRDMADHLQELGCKVIKFNLPLGGIYRFSGGCRFFSKMFWRKILEIKQAPFWDETIRSESPDLVIVNSMVLSWMGPLIKKAGVKSACFVRETFLPGSFDIPTWVIKHYLRTSFDGVFYISQHELNKVSHRGQIVEVLPDCFDFHNPLRVSSRDEACTELGLDPHNFNLLYVGGYSLVKGVHIILKSLRYLRNTAVKLVIAGYMPCGGLYGPEHKGIKKWLKIALRPLRQGWVKNLKIHEDMISLVGIQKEMSLLYTACDAVVFPSTKPHQARPAFEAGAFSKPVIISDFVQTKEYVANGINGLTFRACSPKSLAAAIKTFSQNKELAKKLGENNYQYTREKHDLVIVGEKLLTAVDLLLKVDDSQTRISGRAN